MRVIDATTGSHVAVDQDLTYFRMVVDVSEANVATVVVNPLQGIVACIGVAIPRLRSSQNSMPWIDRQEAPPFLMLRGAAPVDDISS